MAPNSDNPTPDRLWLLSDGVSMALLVQLAFWLGVIVSMLAYQVGFLEPLR